MRLPAVLSSLDLPAPELRAAALDGELYAVDRCWSPIDEVESPALRAAALAALLPDRVIAERRSAAWIWGALTVPPAAHDLCVDTASRVRTDHGWPTPREVVLDDGDIQLVGRLRVTTPLRTIVDLVRFEDEADHALIARLLRVGELGIQDCLDAIARRRNLPGKQLALGRLRELSPS